MTSPIALIPPAGTTSLNAVNTPGTYYFSTATGDLVTNKPAGMGNGPFFVNNTVTAGSFATATYIQTVTRYTNEVWTRVTNNDSPTPTWKKITTS